MAYPASPEFYDNLRAIGSYWATDPLFGCVGDGVTDNAVALQNWLNAASANSAEAVLPPGIFKTSAMLLASGLLIRGVPLKSMLSAIGTPRSILQLQGQCAVRNIILNCANASLYGALFVGAANSELDSVQMNSAIMDGFRLQNFRSPAAIVAGAHSGGGPAITMSQPDPFYLNLSANIRIRITLGGALGTATFQFSSDGGATYSGVDQILFSATAIGQPASPLVSSDTGLLLTATAGTYVLNATYDFTVTPPALVTNTGIRIRSTCGSALCGVVYATSGLLSDYAGLQTQTATGTATWTAGSQYVSIPGGGLLALRARDGDSIRLPGANFIKRNNITPIQHTDTTSITCVLSDSLIAIDPADVPTSNGSGTGYAIGVGWSGFVDPTTGRQNDQLMVEGGYWNAGANGFRDGALNAGSYDDAWVDNYGMIALYIGTEWAD